MNNKDYPAYPVVAGNTVEAIGLTKRELMAAMAMQGFCANSNVGWSTKGTVNNIVESSVHIADSLLDELNKGN